MSMVAVKELSWEEVSTAEFGDPARVAWREAVAEIAAKAKETLPECNNRVDSAVKIVLAGDVTLLEDGKAQVASQSNGQLAYHVVNGECTCKDYTKAPSHWCKHRIAAGIHKRATALATHKLAQRTSASTGQAATSRQPAASRRGEAASPPTPQSFAASTSAAAPLPDTSSVPEGLKPFIVTLHGKPFVSYTGLLFLAHERGLVSLKAHFISVTPELALAEAEAIFTDGKAFGECADSTPQNVGPTVRAHFPRIALTRAKARALRDALTIGIAALEELDGE